MTAFGKILAWLKARDLAEISLGVAVGFLAAAALFTAVQMQAIEAMDKRAQLKINLAIENAQFQVADAVFEANKFRASLFCAAETIVDGCQCWKPKVKP